MPASEGARTLPRRAHCAPGILHAQRENGALPAAIRQHANFWCGATHLIAVLDDRAPVPACIIAAAGAALLLSPRGPPPNCVGQENGYIQRLKLLYK